MDRGQEIRELKLGASFTNPNARTVYHTIKYDFKPASVDAHKEATLETGSKNEVTVTVPHLDGSGVPNTIFKGNEKPYSKKECVLIFNRETNEIIIEKLCNNIAVKKTRTDTSHKQQQQQQQQQQPPPQQQQQPQPPPPTATITTKVENQTARHSSKTRVSTGIRKNPVLNFVPKHSPLQGSPSYPHKSPQQAPSWNANNSSTLPSIPSLLDDNFASNQPPPYSKSSSNNNNSTSSSSSSMLLPKASNTSNQLQPPQSHQQMAVDDIGVLSSSDSSSDDDSDSDSDSAESVDNHPTTMGNSNSNGNNNINMAVNHRNNNNSNGNSSINNNSNHKKGNHLDNNSTALLRKDLCLSDSNSDSDDF